MRLKLFALLLLAAVQLLEAAHNAEAHHEHGVECPVCIVDHQSDSATLTAPSALIGIDLVSAAPQEISTPCRSLIPQFRKSRSPPSLL